LKNNHFTKQITHAQKLSFSLGEKMRKMRALTDIEL
jgi:hypothetical protein